MRVNQSVSGDFNQASDFTSDAIKTSLTDYLESQTGWVTFADIADNVASLENAEQGVIHQACFDSGYTRVELGA